MPIAAIFIVFAVGVAALVRVATSADPTLIDILPALGAMLVVPLAFAKDLFSTDPNPRD